MFRGRQRIIYTSLRVGQLCAILVWFHQRIEQTHSALKRFTVHRANSQCIVQSNSLRHSPLTTSAKQGSLYEWNWLCDTRTNMKHGLSPRADVSRCFHARMRKLSVYLASSTFVNSETLFCLLFSRYLHRASSKQASTHLFCLHQSTR